MSDEKIAAAAVKFQGLVASLPPPARHHHILKACTEINRKVMVAPSDQGFLTSTGRFVGRAEAFRIAEFAGQMKREPGGYTGTDLFSEDLW